MPSPSVKKDPFVLNQVNSCILTSGDQFQSLHTEERDILSLLLTTQLDFAGFFFLIHDNPFVRPPLLVALMNFAKTNRLVHIMPEPLAESFPDLTTRSHDIQKANKSQEERRSARKVSISSLATRGQFLPVTLLPLLNQSSILRRDLN